MAPIKGFRVLIINPNTSTSITKSFKPFISSLPLHNTTIIYWTNPTGHSIIKSQEEINESAIQSLSHLVDIVDEYDGFVTACYADHLLTRLLKEHVGRKPVVSIFEASLTTAIHLLHPGMKFGIITTGVAYEAMLSDGVRRVLGASSKASDPVTFGGVVATGISPAVLETESRDMIKARVVQATRRLVRSGDVEVVCMGGVILAGMEDWVREACLLELGLELGKNVRVVEQLQAGVTTLDSLLCMRI